MTQACLHTRPPVAMSALLRFAAGLLAVSLSSGCVTVGPDFETPAATLDAEWVEATRPQVDASQAPPAEWWQVFNDPELTRLIAAAYANNLTLRAAGLRIYEARATLGIARGLRYPQSQAVSGGAAAFEQSKNAPLISLLPDPVRSEVEGSGDLYQIGFDAIWELDFWGRYRRGIEAADASLAASVASFDAVMVILAGEVASTYVRIRTLEERLVVAADNVASQERGLELAEIRFNGGLTTALDARQASALLNGTRASVAALTAELRRAENALAVLLGTTAGELKRTLEGPGSIPVTPTDVAVGMPAELLRRRPDILRAELRAAAQSARIGVARADLYPAFILGGNIGFAAASTGDLFESNSRVSNAFASFYLPVFNYGRLKNRVRAEDARFEAALANYQHTVLAASREVEDALIGFAMAQEQTRHFANAVEDASEAVRLAEIMYEEGAADYTRVLTAQQGLLAAQDSFTATKGNVALNLIAAYKALGGGWQMRDEQDFIPSATREAMAERTHWGELLQPGQILPVE